MKIKALDKWGSEYTTYDMWLTLPTIISKNSDSYTLRSILVSPQLNHDIDVPKENVETVSTFRGWLHYVNLPKCYCCGEVTSEEYVCNFCEEFYCDNCSAKVTLYNNPERNCCLTCQENSKHG